MTVSEWTGDRHKSSLRTEVQFPKCPTANAGQDRQIAVLLVAFRRNSRRFSESGGWPTCQQHQYEKARFHPTSGGSNAATSKESSPPTLRHVGGILPFRFGCAVTDGRVEITVASVGIKSGKPRHVRNHSPRQLSEEPASAGQAWPD